MFSPRVAKRALARYRRKGLDGLERRLVATVAESELAGARVLEIGGGIGAVQMELLDAGAEQGEVVELSAAYEPLANELARERGLEGRTTFRVEDVLENPEAVDTADIVVLNRVVCCSPDGVALTGVAARLARRRLLLSFPRDRLAVRLGLRLVNVGMRLMGRSFRVFVHPRSALLSAAEAQGLVGADAGRTAAWEFVAFRRVAEAGA
jgi:hypothetical protein